MEAVNIDVPSEPTFWWDLMYDEISFFFFFVCVCVLFLHNNPPFAVDINGLYVIQSKTSLY